MGPLRYKSEGELCDELNLSLGTELSSPADTPTFLPNVVSSLAAALLLISGSEPAKVLHISGTASSSRKLQKSPLERPSVCYAAAAVKRY